MEIGEIREKIMGLLRPKKSGISPEGQERLQGIKDKLDSQYTEQPSSPEPISNQPQTNTGPAEQSPPDPSGPSETNPTEVKGQ